MRVTCLMIASSCSSSALIGVGFDFPGGFETSANGSVVGRADDVAFLCRGKRKQSKQS